MPGKWSGSLLAGSHGIIIGKGSLLQPHSWNKGKGVFPVQVVLTGPLIW